MQKKEITWIAVLLVLSGIYIRYFTHWFEKPQIGVSASYRPSRRPGATMWTVAFSLNDDYRLTSLKVIPMDGTNYDPTAAPVWHLISDSNSAPVRAFRYGQSIAGMQPALKGIRPDALKPDVVYRLIVSSKDATGSTDFKAKATSE